MEFSTLVHSCTKFLVAGCATFCISIFSCQPVSAQDLIATQAPIDRKLRSVDSVALQRAIDRQSRGVHFASSGTIDNSRIYQAWDTQNVHCYAGITLPDSVVVDLRSFQMPTPSRRVTSGFGYRAQFRRAHKGLDIKVNIGDTIRAAFDGRVRIRKYEADGYGYYIVLRHSNGLETIYGHMSRQLVDVGQEVHAGEAIGLGGNTGRSFGSHLHFETRILGEAIDPSVMFDFAMQDVTGDYFIFRPHGVSSIAGAGSALAQSHAAQASRQRMTTHERRYYKVRRGETIEQVAEHLGVGVGHILRQNNLKGTGSIHPDQILLY